jgi:tetratricopeptide (TPR) repeat protein
MTMTSGTGAVINDLIRKGLAEQQAGRLSSAKTIYEQVLKIEPRHPDALNLLGIIALQCSKPEEAARLIRRAVDAQPSTPGFHANLAQAYLAVRRIADAEEAFRRAAALDPRNPQFAVGAAVCLAEQGLAAEAERDLRSLAQRHPDYPLAWYNLGNVLRNQQRHEEAVHSYRQVIGLDPSFAEAHNELGRILHLAHRFDEAEQAYRQFLALQPGSETAYINLASLLIDRGRFADAAGLCRRGIETRPGAQGAPVLQQLLGIALAHQGDFVSALTAFQAATVSASDNARALWGCGLALLETGDEQGGLRYLERAPDAAQSRSAIAGVYLMLGNMQDGWREYQDRPARSAFAQQFPHVELARELHGSKSKVLLHREQGLGDELFFLRFAPELKARGVAITYRANGKIASILERAPVLDKVTTADAPLPVADLQVLVGDLPQILRGLDAVRYPAPKTSPVAGGPVATVETHFRCVPRVFYPGLPPPLPLVALPQKLEGTRERLSRLGPPPYLGLTWRAGTAPEQQGLVWMPHKEVPLQGLGSAMRGVNGTLLALQRHPAPGELDELSALASRPVHDLTALNEDLETMLALLALIDEYIGVSNTNFHLRAGVSRNARVLVPRPTEWRWLLAGDESPWFPGFRIYRQGADGNWTAALDKLARDLSARHGQRK